MPLKLTETELGGGRSRQETLQMQGAAQCRGVQVKDSDIAASE